jgi:hypothetical protein
MVEAMVQARERERMQHMAEGRRLSALATITHPAPRARLASPKPALGCWFAWLNRRQARRAAAAV